MILLFMMKRTGAAGIETSAINCYQFGVLNLDVRIITPRLNLIWVQFRFRHFGLILRMLVSDCE
jgi:hypothetical protein